MDILSCVSLSQRELTDKENCGIQIPFRRTKDIMQREHSQGLCDDFRLLRVIRRRMMLAKLQGGLRSDFD